MRKFMRKFVLAGVLSTAGLGGSLPVLAQDLTPFQGVIDGQLKAFQDGDVRGAWAYASPMIQGLFGSPQNFGIMVQRGYPMVWDNARVEYLESEEASGSVFQKVRIYDEKGAAHDLLYQMTQGASGWRINGVRLLAKPDLGV
ncbi:MAG: DUF4864 domain-containing protein [Pseudomonadota bacterium]